MKKRSRADGLVYSTGDTPPERESGGSKPAPSSGGAPTAVLRMERKGRGGKSVTVIEFRATDGGRVLTLAKTLKSYCGVGGTTRGNVVELQGDQRDRIRSLLAESGLHVKG